MLDSIAGAVVLFHPELELLQAAMGSYAPFLKKTYVFCNSEVAEFDCTDADLAFIHSPTNVGLGEALNQCAARAQSDGFDWLLTMDQDSEFIGDGVIQLGALLPSLSTNVGVVGPDYLNKGRSVPTPQPVTVLIQSGSMIRLTVWERVGGFDESLFIDGVDHDFCLKVQKIGCQVLFWPRSRLRHQLGRTLKLPSWIFILHGHEKHGLSVHPPYRAYYEYRNNLWLMRRHMRNFPIWACSRAAYLLLRFILATTVHPQRRLRLSYIVHGIRDGLKRSRTAVAKPIY